MPLVTRTDTDTALLETIALLGKLLGLSRSVATVFGVLYTCKAALTVDDIMAVSGLSKSAVSLALRDLIQMGAIQEQMAIGERSRRYIGLPDIHEVAVDMMIARVQYPLSELQARVQSLSVEEERLDQVRSLLQTVTDTLDHIQTES